MRFGWGSAVTSSIPMPVTDDVTITSTPCDARRDLGRDLERVVDQVGLREHDDRGRARVPRGDELTLDSVEDDPIGADEHEHEIHVRGHDLSVGCLAGAAPAEHRAASEDRTDDEISVGSAWGDAHPVADAGKGITAS